MAKVHLMEFWPHVAGLNPRDIAIKQTGFFVSLDKTAALPAGLKRAELVGTSDEIRNDVEKTWQNGVAKNPLLTNNLKPCISSISGDGKVIYTALSDYKSSFWIKTKLNDYSFRRRKAVARQFPFLNAGLVAVTSDDKILMERRPEGFTALGMILNYPCGYANPEHKTLADVINSQCEGELGFSAFDGQGSYSKQIKNIYSIGMQRESCEWTPVYVFAMHLSVPFNAIRPTKETKHISYLPADADTLADKIVELYSPVCKGEVAGKLIPNATCMLAAYVRDAWGTKKHERLMARLAREAKALDCKLKAIEYSPTTSPFA